MATMDGKHMTKDETIKQLIEDLISAMEYHVEQTRPVHMTTVAIQAAKDALNSMPTASVQDQIKAITQEAMRKIHDLENQARREVYNIPPAAPVQVFDHVTAAWQGLRDAQNRSRLISNLINCGTCGYPLAPEERTSLIERDGVMVKPAPSVATLLVQEPVAWMYKDKYGNLNQSSSPTVPPDSFPVYTAAQPAPVVPDVLTTAEGEDPEYVQGWNDCRKLMLQTRNNT